jgi:predicted RNA-binding Zn ribbon-like protein
MTGLSSFPTSTGRPALDLCNTRLGEKDLLERPASLESWFVAAGLTDHAPRVTRGELEAARGLREGIRRALLESDGPALAGLAEDWLDRAPGCLRVEASTLQPRFAPAAGTSCCLLVGAVLDALDIARESPGRVRECAGERCPVVFLDTSRNGSRRWCSMERCGSRAKARAYYRRHRAVPEARDL